MTIKYIPLEDSLIRYVPFARLRRDENDNVLGVLPTAFHLRPSEKYLSATWVDFFQGHRQAKVEQAIRVIRNSRIEVRTKSAFAVGINANICTTCLNHSKKHKLRVIHEQESDNLAHVAVRGWPQPDQDDLLQLIADEVWNEIVLNSSIA